MLVCVRMTQITAKTLAACTGVFLHVRVFLVGLTNMTNMPSAVGLA